MNGAFPPQEETPEKMHEMQHAYNKMAANIINQQNRMGQENHVLGFFSFNKAPKQKSKRSKLPKWW